ncbi:RNA polymerase sigma factor RpoD [Lentisphaera araneosa HTCC2155]|uniref:RNA polymerase sigma factor RpoD n=1 Tax=Lentisphaera araneosa HTCC2155 TaxID=313628 RepID=A6DTB5_9BACT|nr:RNA polymerase sigma factor RpoD/SigA [Lentisphaera araneosa]EDM25095.1 RNA polymerase sigma factor RpoD [Lentisphaera araneosa HTCC2155]
MGLYQESIKSYMQSIATLPLVSVEDEIELAKLIEAGSEDAREKLIIANLKLVVKIAHDYKSLGVPLADLISEGNIGLMKAVEKFRPGHGAKFSSYGAWWIKQAIRRAVAEQGRVIRIPVQSAVKIRKIHHEAMLLAEKLGRVPSMEEVAEATGFSVRSVRGMSVASTAPAVSLNTTLKTGEEGVLEDVIPDTLLKLPGDNMNETDVKQVLLEVIDSKLTEREQMIIKMRYGLDGHQQKTLEELSDMVGRTRERVRQIQYQALRKLYAHLDSDILASLQS